jgi:hypothetical protein
MAFLKSYRGVHHQAIKELKPRRGKWVFTLVVVAGGGDRLSSLLV